ncbi:MAG: PepSY domain-containing protein [Synergistaceae bacterium]|nr:PepSY domain-containing protein [Synergistaceae bacterium]MBQ4419085.1 PepSY domain-containing protein [Synergistaceae bacterium]MBQ6909450.1 PepSY domain-containing protein [Synergistaceae bacterium]MBQ9581736.1 PepSY domain-containing protein [Synergistaceae bacterium]MBQ9896068.1 PepSY domain-containing protein [Synergistaceae bacterium]
MKFKKFLGFIILFVLAAGAAWADDDLFIINKAKAQNINLITRDQAVKIADKELASRNIKASLHDADLDNKADKYYNGSDFRPVYELEYKAINSKLEYDFDIDAVTGEILKFKADD